jgi:intracellular sulfur oxidation DsrE/DsrF family protein
MPELTVECLVEGDALPLVVRGQSAWAGPIRLLQDLGVRMMVCHRTMVDAKVDASALLPRVIVVPSALTHIVHQQQRGFHYLKL